FLAVVVLDPMRSGVRGPYFSSHSSIAHILFAATVSVIWIGLCSKRWTGGCTKYRHFVVVFFLGLIAIPLSFPPPFPTRSSFVSFFFAYHRIPKRLPPVA